MTRYQVDSEAVAAAATTIQSAIGRIQAEVTGLNGQLVSLQGSWTGSASAAFQSAVADWTAAQRRMEESLGAINAALAHAGNTYAEIEFQNMRLFAR